MSHVPSRYDVAADLRRAIYASFSKERFKDGNAGTFLTHALKDLQQINKQIDKKRLRLIRRRIRNAMNAKLAVAKRREDLLMAAVLLQG